MFIACSAFVAALVMCVAESKRIRASGQDLLDQHSIFFAESNRQARSPEKAELSLDTATDEKGLPLLSESKVQSQENANQPERGLTASLSTLSDQTAKHLELEYVQEIPQSRIANRVKEETPQGEIANHVKEAGKEAGKEVDPLEQAIRHDVSDLIKEFQRRFPTIISRLGSSLVAVLVALLFIIPMSISIFWVGEKQSAQTETVLTWGEAEAHSVEDESDLAKYDSTLVHLNSQNVQGMEPLLESRFPSVRMEKGCIKLKTTAEVYQWVEDEQEEIQTDSAVGGTTTKQRHSYRQKWCQMEQSSSEFQDKEGHQNTKSVKGLELGKREVTNNVVKYGDAFQLQPDLVRQLSNYQDAHALVGETLQFQNYTFTRHEGGWYRYLADGEQPKAGDCRVKVEYVIDGPATILALQIQGKATDRTFAPYRSVSRYLFCGSDEGVSAALVIQSQKTNAELYSEQKCWSCCFCFCCCYCNIVMMIFAQSKPTQIYSIWPGQKSRSECFESERANSPGSKWFMRLVGFVFLWIGLDMCFRPLWVTVDLIPELEPYLLSDVRGVFASFVLMMALFISSMVVSLVYLKYRPWMGVLYLAMAVLFWIIIANLREFVLYVG